MQNTNKSNNNIRSSKEVNTSGKLEQAPSTGLKSEDASLSAAKSNRGNRRRHPRHKGAQSGKSGKGTYPGNDIAWYQRVPNLLETAKQVAYNIPLGVKLKSTNRVVPGVIAIDYAPIIGYCEPTDVNNRTFNSDSEFYDVWAATPFNIAMRNVYSKVRSSKGGSRPYDYPDLAQMLLSAATIYTYIVHLERVLKCVNRFNFENRYLGVALVSAQGFSYDDLITNYIAYVGRLNLLIEKAKTVAIPVGLATMDEWNWRNSNIFKDTDTDNVKQQLLIDVPNGYYTYDEATGSAMYKPVTVATNAYLSMPTVLRDLESAVSNLWNSETFAILMGDLRFAYNDNVTTIPYMQINDTIEPVFSLEHSIGVQNMNFFHTILSFDNSTVYTSADSMHGLTDNELIAGLSVHQDTRSAELNNGAVYAGWTYNPDDPSTHLRGYKFTAGNLEPDAGLGEHATALLTAHRSAGFCDWSFINIYSDIPDGEVLIYATRMKMIGSFVNENGTTTFADGHRNLIYYQILSTSCCLWLGPRVLIEPTRSSYNLNSNGYRIFNVISNSTNPAYNAIILYGLSNFNVAPKAILYYVRPQDISKSGCYILGDIEVGTDISSNALSTLQSVCLYSQWLVPDTLDVHGFTPRSLTK